MVKKNYKPRIIIVFIAFISLYLIILARLYIIQVHGKNFFQNLAKQQYMFQLKINPNRAKIYDRTEEDPLAFNVQAYSAFILPKQFNEKEKTLNFLKNNYKKTYKEIFKSKFKKFIWLERQLSDEKLEWLKKQELKDIHFVTEPSRFYPFKNCANIVGFTNIDNTGIGGIELQFEKRLAGKPTTVELKKDARKDSFYFNKKIIQKGNKGKKVTLTIDSKLQFLAQEELKNTIEKFNAKSGSVLIMNPDTGEILTMTDYPSFDPNQKIIPNLELTKNNTVTECYEFGSVIKTFSALAALEEKIVTPEEMINCEGKVTYIDKFKVENWKSVDTISFADVIKFSSNVGIAKVVKKLGPKFYTHLKRLGFGQKTGIQFPGERSGFINPPENWSGSSLIVMSFGYELMATLLQLGKAFSIIANGGYDIEPVLIKKPRKRINTFHKKIYLSKTIDELKNILESIGSKYSTGLKDFRIMGKTGTARAVENGKYSNKKHIYSFGGIVEKGDYKRVIITFVKEPEKSGWWASQITAPLFNKVAEKMILNDLTNGMI
jgi:cell division protein FtsI (penicillin-binding protein 3)